MDTNSNTVEMSDEGAIGPSNEPVERNVYIPLVLANRTHYIWDESGNPRRLIQHTHMKAPSETVHRVVEFPLEASSERTHYIWDEDMRKRRLVQTSTDGLRLSGVGASEKGDWVESSDVVEPSLEQPQPRTHYLWDECGKRRAHPRFDMDTEQPPIAESVRATIDVYRRRHYVWDEDGEVAKPVDSPHGPGDSFKLQRATISSDAELFRASIRERVAQMKADGTWDISASSESGGSWKSVADPSVALREKIADMKAAGTWAISSSSSSSSQDEDTEFRDELIAVRERIAQLRAQGEWSTSPSSTASTDSSRHVENDSPPPGAAHESDSERQAATSEASSDSETPPFEDSASDVEAGYLPLGVERPVDPEERSMYRRLTKKAIETLDGTLDNTCERTSVKSFVAAKVLPVAERGQESADSETVGALNEPGQESADSETVGALNEPGQESVESEQGGIVARKVPSRGMLELLVNLARKVSNQSREV